ncbi:phage minor head protein [Crenothrix polyspora]|uniref:Phage head morphogenesis domain-containing protein n=1 Tax=Crenothrix polyspora TaxID=360316 RepID=A0A1R4H170_9GAMM|nr:phage minor head protein [Crenothrix polyspora]SJM89965.1 hypothetical protein CRENPOLYSF1_1290001 [Crenothrix polyspora]
MASPISVGLVTFPEAIKAIRDRGIVLPDVYYGKLQGIARQLAFSVAGLASVDQLQSVLDSLTKALENGETLGAWKNRVLKDGTLNLPAYRLENIYRTNIQNAFNRGRWQKFGAFKASRPYLLYDAINDTRVRPAHLALDGIIRPVGDAFWNVHAPSCGYNCRCRLVSLSEQQAQNRSRADKNGNPQGLNKPVDVEKMKPDKGWDYNPGQDVFGGVERAVAARQGKVSPVLLSAFDRKIVHDDMKILNTESFIPVQKIMNELAGKNPDWFPDGFSGIFTVERADLFMAYHKGAFYVSNADKLVSGFNPMIDLTKAFEKAKTGDKLTFNEEYAVETLWHEIMHSRAQHSVFPKRANSLLIIEGIHQWLSRRTYTDFMQNIGIASQYQKEIMLSGHAYYDAVYNFTLYMTKK